MEIKIPYLNFYKNRHGKTFIYVRRYRHIKGIKIKAVVGSPEFYAEYAAAIAKQELGPKPLPAPEGSHDTVSWLYQQWCASPEWKQYGKGTKKGKSGRLNEIVEVRTTGQVFKFGELDYTQIRRKHIYELRAFKFEEGFPGAANNWVKDLSAMFRWAKRTELAPPHFNNPCSDIPKLVEGPGHHTWTEEEQKQFQDYWAIGTMQRLAYALMVYSGARVSDAYKLGKVHETNNTLTWKPFKGQDEYENQQEQEDALEVSIPIHPELRKAIDTCPSGNLIYCATSFGSPFKSEKGFSQWFVRAREEAGLPDRCVPHGLRSVAAKNLAESGATEYQLMAVMEWTNPAQAKVYTEKENRGKMASAAIHKLSEEQNNDKE